MKIFGLIPDICHSVGTFDMNSDVAIVSDPCYRLGNKEQVQVANIKQGIWKGFIYRREFKRLNDERIQALVAYHDNTIISEKLNRKWKMIAKTFVDTGRMSISSYDKWNMERSFCHYGSEELDTNFQVDIFDEEVIISRTGFGDGTYPVCTLVEDGKVVGIAIVFLP